jgi:hypothetical protein
MMHLLGINERHFETLWLLIVIANLSTLLPLPLLRWLPADGAVPDEQLPQDLPHLG